MNGPAAWYDMVAYVGRVDRVGLHTDKRNQVHSAQSSLEVTHPSTIYRGRRCLTSVGLRERSTELALVATAIKP